MQMGDPRSEQSAPLWTGALLEIKLPLLERGMLVALKKTVRIILLF